MAALVEDGIVTPTQILGGIDNYGIEWPTPILFRGLSRGAMSVVVPISAVCGIAVPVLMGVAALGERPSTLSWLGIVIAVPALWFAHTGTHAGPGAQRRYPARLDQTVSSHRPCRRREASPGGASKWMHRYRGNWVFSIARAPRHR
nr:hypothetical protein [Rhodococcus wratislaviensis]